MPLDACLFRWPLQMPRQLWLLRQHLLPMAQPLKTPSICPALALGASALLARAQQKRAPTLLLHPVAVTADLPAAAAALRHPLKSHCTEGRCGHSPPLLTGWRSRRCLSLLSCLPRQQPTRKMPRLHRHCAASCCGSWRPSRARSPQQLLQRTASNGTQSIVMQPLPPLPDSMMPMARVLTTLLWLPWQHWKLQRKVTSTACWRWRRRWSRVRAPTLFPAAKKLQLRSARPAMLRRARRRLCQWKLHSRPSLRL